MKKNRTMRAATLLLALTLITSCFVGSTFAKYTSEFVATDTARVAEWAFSVDGTDVDLKTAKTFTFNLFDTVYDTKGAADTDDADVEDGVSETIIAPGTYGKVTVALQNDSEVNATYVVDFAADEAGVPLQWSTDGSTWNDDVSALNIAETAINMDNSSNIVLYWKWAFEDDGIVTQSDEADTLLGIDGTAEPTITVTVTATQVD